MLNRRAALLATLTAAMTPQVVMSDPKAAPMPLTPTELPVSAIPNNLGICIMASRVLDFEPILVNAGIVPLPPGYKMRSTFK
jgi:hypothetical protein